MKIDIVIIGINSEATLKLCIESVLDSHYSKGKLTIYYVDGGSKDQSISIAKAFPEVHVLILDSPPTPGKGRNKGWRAGESPLIQFLDSDTIMDPDWLDKAVQVFTHSKIAAVRGNRVELFPEKSLYNKLGNLEWNEKPGECSAFGGDVLILRDILQKTNGYNEDMIAGEDPELSLRIRQSGGKIVQLDVLMTRHDLAMTSFKKYWKRAYRSGYGFAYLISLHPRPSNFWRRELMRIIVRGGLGLLLILLGVIYHWFFVIPGFILLLYPRLFKVKALAKSLYLNYHDAVVYSWHCSFVVIPQLFGVIRYYLGVLFGWPLRIKI